MIPAEQLDFAACVSSGQVFRFRFEEGKWRGVDGNNLITAKEVQGGWEVESFPDPKAWRAFLQMDVDLPAIQKELVAIEPRLGAVIARHPGLRTLGPASAAETLFSFLCTANNHMSRIVRMAAYLAKQGDELGDGHFRFPGVATIAALPEELLRKEGFGYRAKSIPLAARALMDRGEDWLESLRSVSYEEARASLLEVPSIGPKLADCVCLFGLHFSEAVPVDTHVWKACVDWYLPTFKGLGITPSRYNEARNCFSGRFGRLAGWAQQYVFYDRFLSYRRSNP